jgi:hypothetical protein
MKKYKVIKTGNLPARLPIWSWVVLLLAMDHWNFSDMTKGVLITIMSILTVMSIVLMCLEEGN